MFISSSYYTITKDQHIFTINSTDGTKFIFHPDSNLSYLLQLTEHGDNFLVTDNQILSLAKNIGYKGDTMNVEEFKTFFFIQRRMIPVVINNIFFCYNIFPLIHN